MSNRVMLTLDYEEEEQLTTVLHFLSPVLVEYTAEDIPFYGKRAEIIVRNYTRENGREPESVAQAVAWQRERVKME